MCVVGCILQQIERREAWSSRHADNQELCLVQRARDTAGAFRWLQCTANLPADITFVFRHWNADDALPWHQYILQYRTDYTYSRLGVQRGTHTSDNASDSRTTRLRLRDASARYWAENMTDSETLTIQSKPADKSLGRTGHRSAPASFLHANSRQQPGRVLDGEDNVTISTVSLQLPPPHCATDDQLSAAKSVLRCPAIKIHLNNSPVSVSAGPQNTVTLQQAPSFSLATASNRLPRVINECSNTDSKTQQQQPTSSTMTSDSHSTFSGRTMRLVPSNGFSIDDHTMLVTFLV